MSEFYVLSLVVGCNTVIFFKHHTQYYFGAFFISMADCIAAVVQVTTLSANLLLHSHRSFLLCCP
jgi:hypothetical protein